jgi:hypothetical protein
MSAEISTLIDGRLPIEGLAAWCLRRSDGTNSPHSFTAWLSNTQIEQTTARLALAADSLQYQELHPARICWVFSHLRLYLALRSDGSSLTLFIENRPHHPHEKITELLQDFVSLPDLAITQ